MRKGFMLNILKALTVFLLIFLVFCIVWLRSNVISLEYKISYLEKQKVKLIKENKSIIAEKAKLLALERFENSEARGFVFPDRIKVVYVREQNHREPYRITHSRRE
ncbi:MAG: hypothetical protein N2738_08815 [Thermodesulfovibrionales bacterium]|nr:hypothetical protein [Thermodesulfovibrionales bacterium]